MRKKQLMPCFCITVALVETNSRPMGVTLVNTRMSHKLGDPGDLVELAKTVQKVKEKANIVAICTTVF